MAHVVDGGASKPSNNPWTDWNSKSTDYKEIEDVSEELANKYKAMMQSRIDGGEDIDITDALPRLEEMFSDDLLYDFYKDILDKGEMDDKTADADKDILDAIFYLQDPNLELGYHTDNTFTLEYTGNFTGNSTKNNIELNKVDGDTTYLKTGNIVDGGQPFTMNNGSSFNSYQDFLKANNLDSTNIGIRLVGLNAPELPHKDMIALKPEEIITMTLDEAKNIGAKLINFNYDSKTGAVTDRNGSDPVKLYKSPEGDYNEILGSGDNIATEEDKNSLKEGYNFYIVMTGKDESEKDSLADGKAAQKNLHDLLSKADRIILKVDANNMKANKTTGQHKMYYNHWWNGHKVISAMVDQLYNASATTAPITRLSYDPFGTDGYGRLLGEIYVHTTLNGKPVWINANKYVLAKSEKAVANPDFTSSPELNNVYGTVSNSFELWTYDKNNIKYLDSFTEQTKENYTERNELHKKVTGIDFVKFRNCTMMLGDTLFLIPPTSIRNVSGVEYEKVPLLRGKGSMVKGVSAREQYLEIDLFFYDEYGINGIPYDHKLPNGQTITYYLDGLRSLIAQFKVAPYLPIENQYINDVLGIEAVSLVNLNIKTVEGFPRLLQATLTLRDFNYRIFMPDIPIDYKDKEVSEIAEMNPVFAKCFHWEIFRYYYQRAITKGNILSEYEYNSQEYVDTYYSNRNALQKAAFCMYSDKVSLYVPDENWLKDALAVKKDREFYGQSPVELDISDNIKTFLKNFGIPNEKITLSKANENKLVNKIQLESLYRKDFTYGTNQPSVFENVLENKWYKKESHFEYIDNGKNAKESIQTVLRSIIEKVESNSSLLTFTSADETLIMPDRSLIWDMHFKVQLNTLTAEEISTLKEVVRDMQGGSNIKDVLENESITISLYGATNDKFIVDSLELGGKGLELLDAVADNNEIYDGETTGPEETNKAAATKYYYANPAAMQFIPYVENVPLQSMAFGMTNHFTEMSLKMMNGSAPQYMGASDITIEMRIITEDTVTVAMLNVLPDLTMNITKTYRRILNCWPLRIKNEYLQMIGINEVLIDSIQIENLDGYPGVYDIRIRLTSVDRAMRQREMMKQLESSQTTTTLSESNIGDYFDIENALAMAETYPDLDLPSLSELSDLGYQFLKYKNSEQIYPDPDFYMLYGHEYTAKIIKRNIKEVFLDKLFHCAENGYKATIDDNEEQIFMEDDSGQQITAKMAPSKGLEIARIGDVAKYYTEVINNAAEVGRKEINKKGKSAEAKKKKKAEDQEYDESLVVAGTALEYLALADVQEGWELKPTWIATMAPNSTNLSVEKHVNSNLSTSKEEEKEDKYAEEVFEKRKKAIELIDTILSEGIPYNRLTKNKDVDPRWYRTDPFNDAVKELFRDTEAGAELLKLMCPLGDIEEINNFKWEKHDEYFSKLQKPRVLNYLQHFLHAAACTLSGAGYKTPKGDYADYGARQYYKEKGSDGEPIPYCLCEYSGKAAQQAKSMKDAIEHGVQFGMCQIRKESISKILERIEPSSKIDYLGNNKTFKIYKELKDGFIDPYYNKLKADSSELKEYITNIASYPAINAYAFLRVVLMYLRKQIIDGYHISEIDIIGSDNEELHKALSDDDITFAEFEEAFWDVGGLKAAWKNFKKQLKWDDYNNDGKTNFLEGVGTVLSYLNLSKLARASTSGFLDTVEDVRNAADANEIEDETDDQLNGEMLVALRDGFEEKFTKSFCVRWVYPFVEAATQTEKGPSSTVTSYFEGRKFEELNILTSSLLTSTTASTEGITRFLTITAGSVTNITDVDNGPSTTSDAQKIMNTIMREAYTSLSEDPQAYILHSFYDMLVHDKRGRLIRAFPTYYVVFMDEGRQIGSWKLFDNFYNMSAISELTVTKSRKIAADTCSFVMTNMFNSYANEYDNTTRENYVDVYTCKDVFSSIFTPSKYVQKEDILRRRQKIGDVTILRPGVRLHIRMGYGANAGRLPVVFNGRIAEIDVGDVVTIVGQGDGVELLNPLNALGEVEAKSLVEAQQWTTIAKDLRGSLARGGLSPRNLLAQLLTAQHGGVWKTGIRKLSDDRWYGDNPFGIYHFGDRRFSEIFVEGEVVQNLFEVVDGTILSGSNELYPSKETTTATPTLNTSIQDKTFWDLLTMCAYSGVGYIGAVRDFGFRSTVFLGKPNHYYAYNYQIIDGKFAEKRKPFQQFHYYDSYTDIIYNSIKASDKNIKTNAVGVWEGTDVFWGQEQKTCGPLYLDMNIYPEYQKSMTVDTGLIARGNGGIDIPFTTHFSEEWNINADADKVNKSLAERITGNALRETLKSMYTGEICVIGDPSVKPYDRFHITDVYEDMTGQMEVEAVVYSMNFNTGFTTTIYPDLIVRMDDQMEPVTQHLIGNVVASVIASVTARLGIIQSMASVETKLVSAAAKVVKAGLAAMPQAAVMKIFGRSALANVVGGGSATPVGTALVPVGGGPVGTALAPVEATSFKGFLETCKLSGGNIYAIVAMIIIAVSTYIFTKNTKSFLTRWIKSIQMLDVYPIFKNQRPFIAGLNGHRGCVVGYQYSEEETEDSIQGMINKCVNKIDDIHLGPLLNVFLDREAYNQTLLNWSNTLTHLDLEFDAPNNTQQETIAQEALNSVSKEYGGRSSMTAMLTTKYRIQSFNTNNGTDPTYLKYRNMGVIVGRDVKPELIEGTNITVSSLYTNKNILSLYPVEDDPDVKKAITGSHSNLKSFDILHSTGNKKDNLNFESGSRIIRYIVEENPNSTYSEFRILDLPMIHEDAMYVLKFIMNDEHLKNKKLSFLSGARVNDSRSWKNTGFAFEIQSNDEEALEKAVKAVKNDTRYNIGNQQVPLFNYKMNGDTCAITVYAEKVEKVKKTN